MIFHGDIVMLLKEIGVKPQKVSAFAKKDIYTVEELKRNIPRKYYDFRQPVTLSEEHAGNYVAVVGTLLSVTVNDANSMLIVNAKVEDENGKKLNVSYIGSYFMRNILQNWIEKIVVVCGELKYNEQYHSFSMLNPIQFTPNLLEATKIVKQYGKIKGISEQGYEETLNVAFTLEKENEYVPEEILAKYNLPEINEALRMLHYPKTMEEITLGKKRLVFDDLLYFACKLEQEARNCPNGSPFGIKTMKNMLDIINNLPYDLTNAQKQVITELTNDIKAGKRINALVQGDVGCGKTIVAILLMFAMADSGYQSVLMTPTVILAGQHYKDIKGYADKYGYKVAFLGGKQTAKEKREILKGIKNGDYQFIVGTHAVIGKNVEYKNLGLAITDEEHKFGVLQRDAILNKAVAGTHTVIMSATPIPRTLANTIYGNNIKVCTINELPSNRQPLQTAIASKDITVFHFMEKELQKGRQAYVVCPLIDKADKDSIVSNVASVEDTLKAYEEYFAPKGYKIACITGKTEKETSDAIIKDFKDNKYQILIATTIIEVGVNVPNASLIVISNAERFGLSALHQLRGRVGRGQYQSYCILKSDDKENERLNVLCQTNDGFKIAEADLAMRKTGDLLGTKQSGKDKYVELMLTYPNMFEKIRELSKLMCDNGTAETVIYAKENITEQREESE